VTEWGTARCIGLTDLFFSEKKEKVRLAKDICEGCPIRHDCLIFALESGEAWGVWGGYDYQELRIIAPMKGYPPPERKAVEHGTERGAAWHRRRKEQMCEECLFAYNKKSAERMRLYRKRRREEGLTDRS
jgi:Transcription factor WhiB